MVFSYYPQTRSFVVVFPDSDQIDDIGISWPQLFGEEPWGEGAAVDVVKLLPVDAQPVYIHGQWRHTNWCSRGALIMGHAPRLADSK
eukprot:2157780-Prymnesium_polylepis.1